MFLHKVDDFITYRLTPAPPEPPPLSRRGALLTCHSATMPRLKRRNKTKTIVFDVVRKQGPGLQSVRRWRCGGSSGSRREVGPHRTPFITAGANVEVSMKFQRLPLL